jgi:hypothetical protein
MTTSDWKRECEDREPNQSIVNSIPVNFPVSSAGLGDIICSPLVYPVIGLGSS